MPLFRKRKKNHPDNDKKSLLSASEEASQDVGLQEELDVLTAREHPRDVDRIKTEAERTISDATLQDIRGITLIERGRCPDCGGKTETTVSSVICPACGWYRWRSQEANGCIVHLDTGEKIKCDRFYNVKGDQLLCVSDDVARHTVSHSSVRRIEFVWDEKKLQTAREQYEKERTGICDWCGIALNELDVDAAPIEDHVAFGAFQEKFRFCGEKCLVSFRKQYPARIHRNCYVTDCNSCHECIKRFDTSNIERYKPRDDQNLG